ncbi:MAG: hypothetical protein EAX81_07475, partial [Candidatus Thorarchaeota archaeon]|nr:hypothetical protein [Candidatus Thorarchaeota archaeon]
MMSEPETLLEYQSFRRKLRERVLLGSIVAILIGATILAIAPENVFTFGRLSTGDQSLGTVGHSITDQSSPGQTEFVLLNTTEFTWESGWITETEWYEADYIGFYQDSRGFHVEGSRVRFLLYYYLNIIVDHYDTLKLSTLVSSESGNFTIGISSYFGLWWSDSFHRSNSTDVSGGEERFHTLNISMDWVRSNTNKWIVQARLELEITIQSYASILIQRATVKASSSAVLYPVAFGFQDKLGVGLYDAKETRRLLEIPVLNLRSDALNKSAVLMQWSPDETIHVPIGSYSAE